ncbi:MAG: hypothetical protein US74_C0020G0011 [Parcubacteria group bacterium GW2011_GWA2_38_13]|nr:MAG: hypothetical protein US74_C0020G0011 [Parcubacteria group bacterium GW2011_GWA2_38_13]
MDSWINDLDRFFLEATAQQLGLPVEKVFDHDFREWYRRQLPGEDGSPSIAEEKAAAEELSREACEFLAQFATSDEDREALLNN